jgi:TPR repeat protein
MEIKNLIPLLVISISQGSIAQVSDGSSQQVYDSMKRAEFHYKIETANDQCPTNDRTGFWGLCVTKNSIDEYRLREVLRSRADSGDPIAQFYWGGEVASSGAYRINDKTEIGIKARIQSYDSALTYYKKACPTISEACWNVADIYAKGLGSTKSSLAALEWFYKAGGNYLAKDQREEALASLEAMEKIDPKNSLALKLKLQLQKGAPK